VPTSNLAARRSEIAGSAPHLEKRGSATHLVVDGKPFLMLGGELHNSSSSSVEYMKSVWPRLATVHLNTLLMLIGLKTVQLIF
jgi:hypothetical protein